MTGEEMARCDVPDKLTMFSYLSQIYDAFRGEIPHIKHPKLVSYFDSTWLDVIRVSREFIPHTQQVESSFRNPCTRSCQCSRRFNKLPDCNNNRVERNRVMRYKSFFESKTRVEPGRTRQRQLSRTLPLVI